MVPASDIPVIENVSKEMFDAEIRPAIKPVIMRGLVKGWACVEKAQQGGPAALFEYLSDFDNGQFQDTLIGPPEIQGRFAYSDDLLSQNFTTERQTVSQAFKDLLEKSADGKARFIQSLYAQSYIPGFSEGHRLPLLETTVQPRLWIGNQTTVQTHFDLSENIACVVLGTRSFTLFPPEQFHNLYPGPLESAPGRIPVSLTSLDNPDFEKHPGFEDALTHRVTGTLEPGDAIYMPAGWWHHVRANAPLNMLVNYWWSEKPAQVKNPYTALIHGMLAYQNLSEGERNLWRHMFDYFVFQKHGEPMSYLDPSKRGFLGGVPPEHRNSTIYDVLTALAGEVGLPPPPRPPKK
ncbi:cupin-like domain-containing protein [Hellea balneolensis]|uniref:cupin-like domain-containing protein n=1 Tax=Hellea balneolensis TaxID=287478 RepID=UPI0003F9FAF0|nr:cupin-like domain-containing protein [Hellea balneolensis]